MHMYVLVGGSSGSYAIQNGSHSPRIASKLMTIYESLMVFEANVVITQC